MRNGSGAGSPPMSCGADFAYVNQPLRWSGLADSWLGEETGGVPVSGAEAVLLADWLVLNVGSDFSPTVSSSAP